MKKRIAAVCAASAIAVAGFAGPASAQGKSESAPNCEQGQLRATLNAVRHLDLEQFLKHGEKFVECGGNREDLPEFPGLPVL
jgi:hypothetical protein